MGEGAGPTLGLMLPLARAQRGRGGLGGEGMFKSKLDIPENKGLFRHPPSNKKGYGVEKPYPRRVMVCLELILLLAEECIPFEGQYRAVVTFHRDKILPLKGLHLDNLAIGKTTDHLAHEEVVRSHIVERNHLALVIDRAFDNVRGFDVSSGSRCKTGSLEFIDSRVLMTRKPAAFCHLVPEVLGGYIEREIHGIDE